MEEFKGTKAFLMIPVGVARDQELLDKPKAILLMGEILSMLNVTGEFFMSNTEIAKRLNATNRSVQNYLTLLENKGLIKRVNIYADKEHKIIKGRKITAGSTLVKCISLGWGNKIHEGGETDFTPLVKQDSPKYNNIKEQNNRTTNKDSPADAEHHIPYEEIIDYLNKKAGTHYKATTTGTKKLIKARWHEGYTLKDFKTVINNKAFEWQTSPKMWRYMRPATLFSSKFDDYLNANNLDNARKEPTTGGYEELLNEPNIQDIPDSDLPF